MLRTGEPSAAHLPCLYLIYGQGHALYCANGARPDVGRRQVDQPRRIRHHFADVSDINIPYNPIDNCLVS